jgi:protein-disulfide isomerase
MSKGSAIISILIAFVGGILIGHLTSGGGDSDSDEVTADSAGARGGDADDINAGRPWKGGENALVTIVEISDFECPFCSRVNPTMDQIQSEYGDRVKIVWRNNPLPMHPNAPLVHNAAMEVFEQAGNEKFWEYHDKLFQNQRELTRPNLVAWAEQLGGIDMAQFNAALDNSEHQSTIQEDQAWAARVNARGTPNFIVNGQQVSGAQPFDAFKRVIDEELGKAQELVDNGTAASDVFAARFREAFGSGDGAPAAAAAAPQAERQPDPNAVYRVPVDGQPVMGRDDALVTIVEFSEFECPFCARVLPTVAQIKEEYGNDVRFVWRNNPLPFHQNAGPAAQAAVEVFQQAGADKFWQFHDIAFQNQRELTRPNLEAWAQQVGGINMAQFRAALDNNEHAASIEADQNLARSLGASGTPSFFINGRNLRGAQPFEAFKAVIDQELAKARQLVESGTPRNRLYAAIIADGATEQQFIGGAAAPAAQPAARPEPAADQVYDIAVPNNAPSKGPRNAPVVIQEFSDYECPFCGRVLPTLAQVEREYGDRVRIVWRNYPLPFHQNAGPAAQAALEVHRQGGNDKFWAYSDVLFQNQRELTRPNLERWAQELGGINMAQFRQALDTNRHQASIQADMDAVREAGAQIGTPSFFINGRLVQGAQPFEAFKAAIDRALAE